MAPPVAGYALWLDASDTSSITSSGGAVSQWNDKSGNGWHVTQLTAGNKPTTGVNTINGLNVITFDGSNDYLACTASGGDKNQPGYVFVVAYFSGTPAATKYILAFHQAPLAIGTVSGGNGSMAAGTALNTTAGIWSSNTRLLTCFFNGASSAIRVDKAADNSGTAGTGYFFRFADYLFRVGCSPTFAGSNVWNGHIAEIIWYPSDIGTTNRDSVESYLYDKWFAPPTPTITAAATLPALTAAATLVPSDSITAGATLPGLTGAATLAPSNPLSATATLPALTGAAVLAPSDPMTAAATLPALTGAATLAPAAPFTAAATLPALTAAAVLGRIPAPRGTVTLEDTAARGTITVADTTSRGRITIHDAAARGTITVE